MITEQQEALLQGLANLLGMGTASPAADGAKPAFNLNTQSARSDLPMGCVGIKANGVYLAESVNDLYSWDEHVEAKDGGTYKGLKVRFIEVKEQKRSEKSFSRRDGFMARFEISRAGGKNPLNEVINIFLKEDLAYRPYLDPAKWAAKNEIVEFRSEDDKEPDRKMRLNMIYFNNELISDDLMRKVDHIQKRLGGLYEAFIDGVALHTEDEE